MKDIVLYVGEHTIQPVTRIVFAAGTAKKSTRSIDTWFRQSDRQMEKNSYLQKYTIRFVLYVENHILQANQIRYIAPIVVLS